MEKIPERIAKQPDLNCYDRMMIEKQEEKSLEDTITIRGSLDGILIVEKHQNSKGANRYFIHIRYENEEGEIEAEATMDIDEKDIIQLGDWIKERFR